MPSAGGRRSPPNDGIVRPQFTPIPSVKSKITLAVDTSFARSHGQAPQQVYPEASKARGTALLQQHLDASGRIRDGPQRSTSSQTVQRSRSLKSAHAYMDDSPTWERRDPTFTARNIEQHDQRHLLNPFSAKRRRSQRRPPPLDLRSEVSPSECSIPIGMAFPSATVQDHRNTLASAATHPHSSVRTQASSAYGQEINTPTIVITPAEDDFEAGFNSPVADCRQPTDYRPRSSVCSTCSARPTGRRQSGKAPPVPPLPRFAVESMATFHTDAIRDSVQTIPDDAPSTIGYLQRKDRPLSIDTTFEEGVTAAQAHTGDVCYAENTPTPRHSRGWWNIITSPFSASSTARSIFWRSPPLRSAHGQQGEPILAGASDMGLSQDNYLVDGDIDGSQSAPPGKGRFAWRSNHPPKRSNTAPAALTVSGADAVNIYRTPSRGEAALYYDRTRHYPSLQAPAYDNDIAEDEPLQRGWSPLQSDDLQTLTSAATVSNTMAANGSSRECHEDGGRGIKHRQEAFRILGGNLTPDDTAHAAPTDSDSWPLRPDHSQSRTMDDEDPDLQDGGVARGTKDTVSKAKGPSAELGHDISPQSPSPVLESARTARLVRPNPPIGDPEKVQSGPDPPVLKREAKQTFEAREIPLDKSRQDPPLIEDMENEKPRDLESNGEEKGESEVFTRPWHRRCIWIFAGIVFLMLSAAVVLLVLFLTMHHPDMPVEAQWLNLTGFPPMPTGVLTVVGAKPVEDVHGCVKPAALWSCSVPPGQGFSTTSPTQPNFRFLIRFRNGTIANETFLEPTDATLSSDGSDLAARSTAFMRRDLWSNPLYAASPPPPSTSDEVFLGRTTDNDSRPYNGEQTPFYISLLDPVPLPATKISRLKKRDFHFPIPPPSDYHRNHASTLSSNPAATSVFPLPKASSQPFRNVPLSGSGHPAPPELYPLAYAQPLRLFNRGQPSEHYGFFTYFDRTLYLSTPISNTSTTTAQPFRTNQTVLSDVPLSDSSAVCTWSQTRFLIQIWTSKGDVAGLALQPNASLIPAAESTANDMQAPGSFPYPVTFTLDRHGGTASKKGVYCYDLNDEHDVIDDTGTWIGEDRAFGGSIVDPAIVPTNNGTGAASSASGGGIDGGTGGCLCSWQNFS